MPEMPEVETVRRGLMNIAAGRKIQGIDVYYGKTVENDIEEFRQALIGQTIERLIGGASICCFALPII